MNVITWLGPDRKHKTRLCHVNLLKSYCERNQAVHVDVKAVAVLNIPIHVGEKDTDVVVNPEMSQGRLPNSRILASLDDHLSYLDPPNCFDIMEVIHQHPEFFSDVPTRTNVLHHDIDVGVAGPTKQPPYRVNPVKRQLLRREVDYMLQHGIAEPSASSWSSPCLLVDKSDHTPRFCTDFCKVNFVTKPDCYPLPRLDDCIDREGSANLTLKLAKCEFGQATVTYLGKVVGHGKVCPIGAKVEAIVNFGVPTTRPELKSFLGWQATIGAFVRTLLPLLLP